MNTGNLSLYRNRYAMKNSTSLVNHVLKSLIVIWEFFLSPLASLIARVLFFAERIKIVFFFSSDSIPKPFKWLSMNKSIAKWKIRTL